MAAAAEGLAGAPSDGRRYPSPLVKQDLAKLGKDAESRRAALGSLRAVVEEHLQGPGLSRFMHQLEESDEGRRHAAAIISDLARIHGDRLLPHIPRLLQILAHTLLASAACPSLQADCAKAVSTIAKHAVAVSSSTSSAETVLKRLCLPLIALLHHKVELLSAGSAACLNALVESETWKLATASLVSKLCFKSASALSSKSAQTVPHLNLLRTLALSNSSALAQFSIPLLHLLNQEILLCSSAPWQLRLAAIQLMESLFKAAEQSSLGSHLGLSLQNLAKCRLDKMPHVRKAALSAMRTAEALTVRGDMKKKLVEDLPLSHSPTATDSPLRHSLDSVGNVEDLFKEPLGSPASHRSHALFLSPRTLSELSMNSPSSKQFGSQTPLSDYSAGRATANESDYFCAYFFDTKENVSCRKIVHHIHDTAIGSITPPSSPPKQSRKVAVPPLPLSDIADHDLDGQAVKNSCHSQGSVSTPLSVTRHVMVLDSNAELIASCERSSTFPCNESGDAALQVASVNIMDTAKQGSDNEVSSKSDLMYKPIEQMLEDQRMQAMMDLQAISSRLLDMREGGEKEVNVIEEDDIREQPFQAQEMILDDVAREKGEYQNAYDVDLGCAYSINERHTQESRQGHPCFCPETVSKPDRKEGLTCNNDQEAMETSSEEWSVRNNPIADTPTSEVPLDGDRNPAQFDTSKVMDLSVNANTPRNGPPIEFAKEDEISDGEDFDECEALEEEVLASCRDEVLGSTKGNFEDLESSWSSMMEDLAEVDDGQCISICGKRTVSKLRSFLMGSAACVIPVVMVSMAKLFYLDALSGKAVLMPPT